MLKETPYKDKPQISVMLKPIYLTQSCQERQAFFITLSVFFAFFAPLRDAFSGNHK
jgi:hypothetical protein